MPSGAGDIAEMSFVEAPIVNTAAEFVAHLRGADILLFDKLTWQNRLVQWADNRPVGHCAIWHGGHIFGGIDEDDANLIEATIASKSLRDRGGVLNTALADLLDLKVVDGRGGEVPVVCTVTAMRYRGISDDQRHRVLEYARSRVSEVKFAKVRLPLLAPFALARSYFSSPSRAEPTDRDPSGTDAALRSAGLATLVGTCQAYASRLTRGKDTAERMFCSELVYRAYEAATVPIKILDPLFERPGRRPEDSHTYPHDAFSNHAPAHSSREAGGPLKGPILEPAEMEKGSATNRSEIMNVLGSYDEFLKREVLVDPWARPGPAELSVEEDIPKGAVGRAFTSVQRLEFADMITPGDYWSSPSLDPIAVLHRPPTRRR
ncbi:MAG: hypothetical protein JWN06_2766 [Propionibacteriaceae bacterium]|nr:hypothetical protein [Propionibacteriaceae bacterium]